MAFLAAWRSKRDSDASGAGTESFGGSYPTDFCADSIAYRTQRKQSGIAVLALSGGRGKEKMRQCQAQVFCAIPGTTVKGVFPSGCVSVSAGGVLVAIRRGAAAPVLTTQRVPWKTCTGQQF